MDLVTISKTFSLNLQSLQNAKTQPDLNDLIHIQSQKTTKETTSSKSLQVEHMKIINKIKRISFNLLNYSAYTFAATMLPLLNVLILFTQSYNLSWDNNFASIERKNFQYYYIGIIYYSASILIFILASADTKRSFKQLFRLYALMNSNQICVIASNICYLCLHLVYLCRDVADGQTYSIYPVDIIYVIAFVINNFAYIGHFRVSLVYYKWSTKETLTYKILIFTSSLSYFAYGILIIIGHDNLSNLLNEATNIIQSFIQTTDFGNLTNSVQSQLISQMNRLSGNISTIQNLINLFVFTSFANICQVLNRMNDFDKSSHLEPVYEINDEQNEQQPDLQNLKAEIDNRFVKINQKLNSMVIIKQAIKGYLPTLPNKTQSIINISSEIEDKDKQFNE